MKSIDARTLLIIDDNPDDETLTRRALHRAPLSHVQIVVARDGVDALALLLGDAERAIAPMALPQLVLLDLKMPRLSGLDVLERLRRHERTRHVPVVVFTSSSEERDLRRSYELGANAYVRKPVDFAQFSEAVASLGRFWLGTNEVPPEA